MRKFQQFCVIGLGRFGASVAKALFKMGKSVLAVDIAMDKVQKLSEDLEYVVQADATDRVALERLKIKEFDVVVVAIENIQSSVLAAMLLKKLDVPYIIAQAHDSLHGQILQQIGVSRIVYPLRDTGYRLAHSLVSSQITDLIELSPSLFLAEMVVPDTLVGLSLIQSNLRSRYGVHVLALRRGGETISFPSPDEILKTEDVMIFATTSEGFIALQKA